MIFLIHQTNLFGWGAKFARDRVSRARARNEPFEHVGVSMGPGSVYLNQHIITSPSDTVYSHLKPRFLRQITSKNHLKAVTGLLVRAEGPGNAVKLAASPLPAPH